MDHPPSLSPSRPAKRQRRLSELPMDDIQVKQVKDCQPEAGHAKADHATIALKVSSSQQLVNITKHTLTGSHPLGWSLDNAADAGSPQPAGPCHAHDFYFCLWDSYVVKSADKIHLDEEQQGLQECQEWLEVENDLLVQRCNEQSLLMWSRERVLRELHAGIAAVLKASGETAFPTDMPLARPTS